MLNKTEFLISPARHAPSSGFCMQIMTIPSSHLLNPKSQSPLWFLYFIFLLNPSTYPVAFTGIWLDLNTRPRPHATSSVQATTAFSRISAVSSQLIWPSSQVTSSTQHPVTLLKCETHRVPSLCVKTSQRPPSWVSAQGQCFDELQCSAHPGASHCLSAPLPYFLVTHFPGPHSPPLIFTISDRLFPLQAFSRAVDHTWEAYSPLILAHVLSFSGLCSKVISDVWASLAAIFTGLALLSTFCSNISFYHLLLCFSSRAVNFLITV